MKLTKRESSPDLGGISGGQTVCLCPCVCVFIHIGTSLGFALDVVQG